MRASVTVPLLYSPLVKDSMFMVDGGLTSNIPADVARLEGCDIVIVVNSTSSMRSADQLGSPWEIADQIMTIMMQPVNQAQMKLADIVITPETGERIVSDFSNIGTLVSAGERSADAHTSAIRALLQEKQKSSFPSLPDSLRCERVQFHGDVGDVEVERTLREKAAQGALTMSAVQTYVNDAFATGKFSDVYAEIDQTSLHFYLKRNSFLRDISYDGNSKMPAEKIDLRLAPLTDHPVNYQEIQKSLEHIVALYRENGFSLARIESVAVDAEQGTLKFRINEGVIAQIIYEGNERTRDYVIRREFPLGDGDVFTIADATRGIVNIKSTGLFEYVLVDVRYKENRPTLVLKVKEKSAELLRFGVHADNEHNIVGTMNIRDANFRGAWEDIGVTGRYGFRDRVLLGEYTINRIFNSYFTFNLKAYTKSRDIITYINDGTLPPGNWERLEAGKYSEGKYGWSIAFGSYFEKYGDITAEVRSEQHKIVGITGTGFTPEQYHYVGVKVQSIVDTEDKFSFPTTGVFLRLSYESANKRLGSDVSFSKIGVVYESYITLAQRHTFRPKVTFGFADETLPPAEQFSLGGQQSFFGLREDDSRGRQLFVMNMEYRFWFPYKFIFETYLKVRYDLGTISLMPQELKFNTFRHGVGIEVALDTPLGPVSAGAGKSFYFMTDLPNSPVSTGPVLFYFSLGSSL
jgi:outer membrane protein assembly factor BamA